MTDVSIVLRDLESFNNEIKVAARKVRNAIVSCSIVPPRAKSLCFTTLVTIVVFRLNEEFHSSSKIPS